MVLIPKCKTPVSATDYRPISLCNVVYKIIAKVLVNKLKTILPRIIDESQSAFIPGRVIFDNIIVAHEVLHSMHTKKKGKSGFLAAKVDMSKAYDRVEWHYLEGVMTRMGFSNKWISLVMECVSSVSYSVVVNGKCSGNIALSRGLRQGDPISPFLFLLCAEGLSCLIRNDSNKGISQGVAAARYGPNVSHLFFADDCLFFCKAKKAECEALCNILKSYEEASGKMVNLDKSGILFSPNTSREDRNMAMDTLLIHKQMGCENYLGLPIMFGRSKKKKFRAIKEKIWA